jgi:hypothetical protein
MANELTISPALLHGSELSAGPPFPERGSHHSVAVGHPETGHCVENLARELHLYPLACQGATPHTSADDRLVSMDRVLDHAAPRVDRVSGWSGCSDSSPSMRPTVLDLAARRVQVG